MKYPKGQNRKHKAANYSPKQERRVADLVGGKNTPASGAKEIKGDIRLKGLLRIECKATEKSEYVLTHKVIDKIKEQAHQKSLAPSQKHLKQVEKKNTEGNKEQLNMDLLKAMNVAEKLTFIKSTA
jgi:hypothetical protein